MRARLSSKGQLVLPKRIRDKRGWNQGSKVEIEEVPGGVLLRLVRDSEPATLDALLGCTGYRGAPRTLAQMEAAIREGAGSRR